MNKLTIGLTALALAGCGGGGGGVYGGAASGPATTSSSGTVAVSMTDAPACGFDAVNVMVSKVRIHSSASAGDTDSGWTDITLSPAKKVNLLNLTNGALDALGQASLGAGHYSQLRLVLDSNGNTIVPTGGAETLLDLPSAYKSGIKLVNEFDVAAGQKVDLVLDFDACKSIVTRGNGSYMMKPVVKVVPTALNGINGYIASNMLSQHVTISAQQGGNVISSTVPNPTTGEFFLSRLATGNYDVVISADGRATYVVGAVPVASSSSVTPISTQAAPLTLSTTSAIGKVSGAAFLSPASTTDTPLLTARQTISSGPTVTIQARNADMTTGAYALDRLPRAAPMYAGYSALLPLAFAPTAVDMLAPGRYRIDATATGYASKTRDLADVSAADITDANFTLTP